MRLLIIVASFVGLALLADYIDRTDPRTAPLYEVGGAP